MACTTINSRKRKAKNKAGDKLCKPFHTIKKLTRYIQQICSWCGIVMLKWAKTNLQCSIYWFKNMSLEMLFKLAKRCHGVNMWLSIVPNLSCRNWKSPVAIEVGPSSNVTFCKHLVVFWQYHGNTLPYPLVDINTFILLVKSQVIWNRITGF